VRDRGRPRGVVRETRSNRRPNHKSVVREKKNSTFQTCSRGDTSKTLLRAPIMDFARSRYVYHPVIPSSVREFGESLTSRRTVERFRFSGPSVNARFHATACVFASPRRPSSAETSCDRDRSGDRGKNGKPARFSLSLPLSLSLDIRRYSYERFSGVSRHRKRTDTHKAYSVSFASMRTASFRKPGTTRNRKR